MQLTVNQVHNLVQQKIALLSDRAWLLYEREGVDFDDSDKAFCEFTRLHAMDELLQYRSAELTYPQLEEFYATALQIGGYSDMPFLPFDFSFLNTAVYVPPAGGLTAHTHPVNQITGLYDYVVALIEDFGGGGDSTWTELASTTDQVGAMGVGTKLAGLTWQQIIKKMAFSYQRPSFQSFTALDRPLTYEVGQQITGTINFVWAIENTKNVANAADSGSLTTNVDGVMTPTGAFNLFGTTGKSLTMLAPYTRNTLGSLSVYLNGKDSNGGNMPQATISYNWVARIYHLNNLTGTASAAEVAAGNSFLTNSQFNTFTIIGSGYKYIWIPNIIDQTNIKFIDPVNQGFSIDMEPPVALTVTNPQGLALAGQLYRTTNKLGANITVTIQ